MSPGRTAVAEEIQDLVAETGNVLLQLLERDGERCCEFNEKTDIEVYFKDRNVIFRRENENKRGRGDETAD